MEALRITNRLKRYFDTHLGTSVYVHSVFSGAFNLVDSDGVLIGVLSCSKDLSPMSMVVNKCYFDVDKIIQGHLIKLSEGSIKFIDSPLTISIKNPEIVDLSLQQKGHVDWLLVHGKLNIMRDVIIESGSMDGITELIKYISFKDTISCVRDQRDVVNEYSEFIQERLMEMLNDILNEDLTGIENMIPKIVGFGPGLTPATDDFLTGILIAQQYLKNENMLLEISEWMKYFEGKTTKISENMISNATEGYVAESYKRLIEALYKEDAEDISLQVEKVIQTGSSSGSDFLFGVYCMAHIQAMRYWKNKK
jgi:hypothetical protein